MKRSEVIDSITLNRFEAFILDGMDQETIPPRTEKKSKVTAYGYQKVRGEGFEPSKA